MSSPSGDVAEIFEQNRGFLWGYCYRMAGDATAADDLVQETFVRALEKPPPDTTMPWRPWLVRVATNLAHDEARRAQRRRYVGPWLPSPLPTGAMSEPGPGDGPYRGAAGQGGAEIRADRRVELLESASIAFLLALEALTPTQRSVLLLRDVYDYSVGETAEMLELSQSNVKVTLHRARRALESYDAERVPLDAARIQRTGEMLQALLERLAERDIAGVQELFAESIISLSDGNGRFYTAKIPVDGVTRVAKLYSSILPGPEERVQIQPVMLNHLPAVVFERPDAPAGFAKRAAMSIDVDREGRIARIYTVVATEKLAALDHAALDP